MHKKGFEERIVIDLIYYVYMPMYLCVCVYDFLQ